MVERNKNHMQYVKKSAKLISIQVNNRKITHYYFELDVESRMDRDRGLFILTMKNQSLIGICFYF